VFADITHREAWNKYHLENLQTWDDISFFVCRLDEAFTHAHNWCYCAMCATVILSICMLIDNE
jgi:hypothetical protein